MSTGSHPVGPGATDSRQTSDPALLHRVLDALFRLGAAVDEAENVDALLERLPALLSAGFQSPRRVRAAVRYRGQTHGDPSALDLPSALSFPIVIAGDERGLARVAVPADLPFLDEERGLMRLAERILRKGIERHEFERGVLQAEKLASLGRLVAGVAHEVNNPAQFLRGNLEILREAVADMLPLVERAAAGEPGASSADVRIARLELPFFREQVGPLLDDMFQAVDRIRDLVLDLKRFARSDAMGGRGRLDEAVDVNEVVASALRVTRSAFRSGIVVRTNLDPSLPPVAGNARQIEQVLVGVLINATEAMSGASGDAGRVGGIIDITTARETVPPRVVLTVGDDGPGMPESVRARAFEPFFTTRHAQGGTGLGLSIAYGIVRAHGGTISIESAEGEGTTIRIALPAAP